MLKFTIYHSPDYYAIGSTIWCITLEWKDESNRAHFHSICDSVGISRMLSTDSIEALRESTGQNIAFIRVSEAES
jgi:hypothetical protein